MGDQFTDTVLRAVIRQFRRFIGSQPSSFDNTIGRFIVETALMAFLIFFGVMVWDYINAEIVIHNLVQRGVIAPDKAPFYLSHPWEVVAADISRVILVNGTVFMLSVLVYYGTSGEVTPLYIVRRFTRRTLIRLNVFKPRRLRPPAPAPVSMQKGQNTDGTEGIGPKYHAGQKTVDDVSKILHSLANSAEELAVQMKRRMNAYLTLGIIIGGIGLIVWGWTNSQAVSAKSATTVVDLLQDFVLRTLPKVTILIFVEVLAGFFLRQYRVGVEDFKYFLQLKRQADANRLVYELIVQMNDDELAKKFFDSLVAQSSAARSDDTLKVMESAENPNIKIIETLGGTANEVVKAMAAVAGSLKGK